MNQSKILFFLRIERFSDLFQGTTQNVGSLKHNLVNAGEWQYSKKHLFLSNKIQTLQKKMKPRKQSYKLALEQSLDRLESLVKMNFKYVLKL